MAERHDPIDTAMAEGVRRALIKRATDLRIAADKLATTTTDHTGRKVPIMSPKARIMASTADVLDECAKAVTPPR